MLDRSQKEMSNHSISRKRKKIGNQSLLVIVMPSSCSQLIKEMFSFPIDKHNPTAIVLF